MKKLQKAAAGISDFTDGAGMYSRENYDTGKTQKKGGRDDVSVQGMQKYL